MKTRRSLPLPALFHRVFLSHLVIILLCFVIGLALIDYIFADGLRLYRIRSPLILYPVLLGLIGIAGLFALWSTGAVAAGLHRFTNAMDNDADEDALKKLVSTMSCEEAANAVNAVADSLHRSAHRTVFRPFIFVTDTYLNILATDTDTAARLGKLPSDLLRMNIRDYLNEATDVDLFLTASEFTLTSAAVQPCRIPLRAAGGRIVFPLWHTYSIENGKFLFVGTDIRRSSTAES